MAARPPDRARRRQAILNILRESGTVSKFPDVALPELIGRQVDHLASQSNKTSGIAPRSADRDGQISAAESRGLPDPQIKELLLRKADQSERAAAIEEWIGSPGAPPPE